jgi:hypothetical protein
MIGSVYRMNTLYVLIGTLVYTQNWVTIFTSEHMFFSSDFYECTCIYDSIRLSASGHISLIF